MPGRLTRSPPSLVGALVFLPFALLVVTPGNVIGVLVGEDGPVEWAGALAWMCAAGLFVAMLHRRPILEDAVRPAAFWLAGLALMSFLAAGEEISWGQRLFDYPTPEAIARVNLQNEMNLHNLAPLDTRVAADGTTKTGLARWLTFGRIGSLIWIGFLIILPVAYRYVGFVRRLSIRMHLPVPPIEVAVAGAVSYVAFSAALLLADVSVAEPKLIQVSANELKETMVASLFFATALHLWRRRPQRDEAPASGLHGGLES